jgi:hypothetical protein
MCLGWLDNVADLSQPFLMHRQFRAFAREVQHRMVSACAISHSHPFIRSSEVRYLIRRGRGTRSGRGCGIRSLVVRSSVDIDPALRCLHPPYSSRKGTVPPAALASVALTRFWSAYLTASSPAYWGATCVRRMMRSISKFRHVSVPYWRNCPKPGIMGSRIHEQSVRGGLKLT